MSNLTDKLNEVREARDNIKTALENKRSTSNN